MHAKFDAVWPLLGVTFGDIGYAKRDDLAPKLFLTSVTLRITLPDDSPIRHKGLKRLYEDDDPRGVMAEHAVKLRDILARLDAARLSSDMDLPGFQLHPLKGELKGFWAVTVRANWRVIFRFADPDALDVDYVDYH